MKKLILLLGILSMGAHCDIHPLNSIEWHVKNATNQVVKIEFPAVSGGKIPFYEMQTLQPGESVVIYRTSVDFDDTRSLPFTHIFDFFGEKYDGKVSWKVLSEDDSVLQEWDLNVFTGRFFDRSEWSYDRERNDDYNFEATHLWTFDIEAQDIEVSQ